MAPWRLPGSVTDVAADGDLLWLRLALSGEAQWFALKQGQWAGLLGGNLSRLAFLPGRSFQVSEESGRVQIRYRALAVTPVTTDLNWSLQEQPFSVAVSAR